MRELHYLSVSIHGRQLGLFCKRLICNKPLCSLITGTLAEMRRYVCISLPRVSFSLSLSLSLSTVSLSRHLSFSLSISLSVSLSLFLSFSLYLYLFFSLYMSLSRSLSISLNPHTDQMNKEPHSIRVINISRGNSGLLVSLSVSSANPDPHSRMHTNSIL